jgi:hypothetical protein
MMELGYGRNWKAPSFGRTGLQNMLKEALKTLELPLFA